MFLLFFGCRVQHLAKVDKQLYAINDELASEPAVDSMIAPYRAELNQEMGAVLSRLSQTLEKGQPESTLGNWVSDLLEDEANLILEQPVDFAMFNLGGLRLVSLPEGDITMRQIYELLPFDNQLAVINMNAEEVTDFVQRLADAGGMPTSRSLRFKIAANGQASDIEIQGKPLASDRVYRIALSDYVAKGGDRLVPQPNTAWGSYGVTLRDAIISALKRQGIAQPFEVRLDQRIIQE